jgi:cytidylate kinase
MIIAIDGPAASGKGTLARRLAAHYALPHLDTGMLYRAVAHAALSSGLVLADADAVADLAERLDLAGIDETPLRGREMGEAASVIAAHPKVRKALLDLQRRFAWQPGGAVLDGRDIGTVIAPGAQVKIFVIASPEARAGRRHRELLARGEPADFEAVLADIRRRDARDTGRTDAPLRAAPDAVTLDTTEMDIDMTVSAALALVEARRSARAAETG